MMKTELFKTLHKTEYFSKNVDTSLHQLIYFSYVVDYKVKYKLTK